MQPELSSVLAFAARCEDPRVVWSGVNDWHEICDCPLNYAYTCNQDVDASRNFAPESAWLLADRYGGNGLGRNGGSARCAVIGDVQIKGVGLTGLFNRSSDLPGDKWHSTGAVTLIEVGREAVFSSICDAVLPYGAVASLAIISTGTLTPNPDWQPGGLEMVPRMLLLRRFATRPAHFLRNLLFVPGPGMESDGVRVRRAMSGFAQVLSKELGAPESDPINGGLIGLAHRVAFQQAAAHAKRLFHAALSPSNIALDGRYLDFGTMSAVPAFRRRTGTPDPAGPDLWGEPVLIEAMLAALHAHVDRYVEPNGPTPLLGVSELIQEFRRVHAARMTMEFAKLSGVPESTLRTMPEGSRRRAYECMRSIALAGARRFAWREGVEERALPSPPLASVGRFDLSAALRAYGAASVGALERVEIALGDMDFARSLTSVIDDLYAHYLDSAPEERRSQLHRAALRRCVRLNSEVDFLTREAVDRSLKPFEANLEGLGELIDQTIAKGIHVLRDLAEWDDMPETGGVRQ